MRKNWLIFIPILIVMLSSCSKSTQQYTVFEGEFNGKAAESLYSVNEALPHILNKLDIDRLTFSRLVNTPVEQLDQEGKEILLKARTELGKYVYPMLSVYQKFIPLSEVQHYVSNRYRDVRGFVNYLGDVKFWLKPYIWNVFGFNCLYYSGSPYTDAQNTGVAVIRFMSFNSPIVPYSQQFDPNSPIPYPYPAPYTGNGFTQDAIPEYYFQTDALVYYGEIYEITPSGREMLRATFERTGWKIHEGVVITKADKTIPSYNDIVKNGQYLHLRDRFYPIYMDDNGNYTAVSNDSTSLYDGFKMDMPFQLYTLDIKDKSPLEDSIDFYYTFTTIDQDTFQIRGITPEGFCHIVTPDPRLAKKHTMGNYDYGSYRRLIHYSQIPPSSIFVEKGDLK